MNDEYACYRCGKTIDEAEVDRNLMGDFCVCDDCMVVLMDELDRINRGEDVRKEDDSDVPF